MGAAASLAAPDEEPELLPELEAPDDEPELLEPPLDPLELELLLLPPPLLPVSPVVAGPPELEW